MFLLSRSSYYLFYFIIQRSTHKGKSVFPILSSPRNTKLQLLTSPNKKYGHFLTTVTLHKTQLSSFCPEKAFLPKRENDKENGETRRRTVDAEGNDGTVPAPGDST